MSNLRIGLRMSALLAFTLLFASGVQAQATRTWVSGTGNDSLPCSRTAPCKTLAGAIAKTNIGGEITMLGAGGFAPVIITKSITIVERWSAVIWHPFGVRSLTAGSGGLRCAQTTGYFRAALRAD